jgi:hypothetical protein
MTSFSKASLAGKWDKVRAELSHAFSTKSGAEVFTIEDLALLERVADAVVKRGMTAPATVFLESLGPMNFLGSQALYFLNGRLTRRKSSKWLGCLNDARRSPVSSRSLTRSPLPRLLKEPPLNDLRL